MSLKVPPYTGVRVVGAALVVAAGLVVVGAAVVATGAEVVGCEVVAGVVVAVVPLQPAIRKESTRMVTSGIKYFFTIASSLLEIF